MIDNDLEENPGTDQWPHGLGDWGRWPNDRGTLNLVTPEKVLEAVTFVRTGRVIACSRAVSSEDPLRSEPCSRHEMFYAGMWDVAPDRSDVQSSADALWAKNHGMVNTHLDGLAHVGFRGKGFNGHPFEEMVSIEGGATIRSVTQALAVVTRGVFADIVKAKGGRPLQPGESVDELRAVTGEVGPGDALVIRTGGTLAGGIAPDGQGDPHGTWGGLHASCMEFVAERGVALLATDSPGDCFPSPVSECSSPIHVLSLVFIGVHLVHNLDLEEVAKVCAETGRTSFLFSVTALNVPGATGSLVIPIVIL